jgi:uncharacterized RDD family membrane protein YckC
VTRVVAQAYAGVVSRGAAFVVDAGIVAAVAIGSAAVVEVVAAVLGVRMQDLARVLRPVAGVALPLLFAGYNAVFWGLTGRTPGMALLGIRGLGTRGRPVSWTSAVVRTATLVLFPIGSLWCLVDRRHQAVQDKLARTVVLRHVRFAATERMEVRAR